MQAPRTSLDCCFFDFKYYYLHLFVCFPPFVRHLIHCSDVTTPEHFRENALVKRFRENKFVVEMSRYAFILLLTFLQERKFMVLIALVNARVSIKSPTPRSPPLPPFP